MEHVKEAILAGKSVSVTELKRNLGAVIGATVEDAVAVLVHNKPSAYLVSAEAYEELVERLEGLELAEIVRSRANERRIKVELDEL